MTVDAYAHPSLYDVLHTPGTAGEVDLMQRLARRFAPPTRGAWLEPACGTGRYLRVLAGRGLRSVGFDRDASMVAYAREGLRRRGFSRRCRLFEADMADFLDELGRERFDVAFNPVNTFRHLLRENEARRHLQQVRDALHPGGIYIVGISLCRYGEEEAIEDVWSARRGACSVRQIVQYIPPDRRGRREGVFSHLAIDRPSGREHLDAHYELRSYDAAQWEALVRACGLQRRGAIDDLGRDVGDTVVNYQLEVLSQR